MRYYLHKQKSILYSFWQNQFFNTWVNISFNFRVRKSYYIPNYCKLYEESAELDHFALATLDPELQPRKAVHFFMLQTLYIELCSQINLDSIFRSKARIDLSMSGTLWISHISWDRSDCAGSRKSWILAQVPRITARSMQHAVVSYVACKKSWESPRVLHPTTCYYNTTISWEKFSSVW